MHNCNNVNDNNELKFTEWSSDTHKQLQKISKKYDGQFPGKKFSEYTTNGLQFLGKYNKFKVNM